MRILICPDSYKGSADARSVAHAIEQGVSRAISCVSTEMLPMADGGEGSAAIIFANSIMEIPLPIPRSLILSASHMIRDAPAQ